MCVSCVASAKISQNTKVSSLVHARHSHIRYQPDPKKKQAKQLYRESIILTFSRQTNERNDYRYKCEKKQTQTRARALTHTRAYTRTRTRTHTHTHASLYGTLGPCKEIKYQNFFRHTRSATMRAPSQVNVSVSLCVCVRVIVHRQNTPNSQRHRI